MTFDDFVFKLKMLQIPTEAVEACRDFVLDEMQDWGMDRRESNFGAKFDLGFAELSDITSKQQSIDEIVRCIWMGTCDYDSMSRDISKLRYKQLIKNPHKGLKRRVLKSFYLHYFNLDVDPEIDPNDIAYIVKSQWTDINRLHRLKAFQ